MFSDRTFKTPFLPGQVIDLGPDSLIDQAIYVQAEARLAKDKFANHDTEYLIHLKLG